jgi:hypothetical protein
MAQAMCHRMLRAVLFSSLSASFRGVYFGTLVRESARENGLLDM